MRRMGACYRVAIVAFEMYKFRPFYSLCRTIELPTLRQTPRRDMFRRADSLHEDRVNGINPWGVCLKPVPSSRSQSVAPSRDKRPSFLNVILRPVQSLVDRMKARADRSPAKPPPKKTEEVRSATTL